MIVGFYKLLFDLSFYYALVGYYVNIFLYTAPSPWGLGLLAASMRLDLFLRGREKAPKALRVLVWALPALVLLTRPALWQVVHLLPAWGYVLFACETGRYHVGREDFRSDFKFTLALTLLILPTLLFGGRAVTCLASTVPYLTLLLAVGVCLLRVLREGTRGGTRQAVYMGAFVALSALLAALHAPEAIVRGVGLVYSHGVVYLLQGFAVALGVVCLLVFRGLAWVFSFIKKKPEDAQINMDALRPFEEQEKELMEQAQVNPAVVWIGYAFVALLVALIIFLIFRRLLGRVSAAPPTEADVLTEAIDGERPKRRRAPLLRPRETRAAIRFYYRKYLLECVRRGIPILPGQTGEEVAREVAVQFPEGAAEELTALYSPARYSSMRLDPKDADAAAELWKSIKHSRPKL